MEMRLNESARAQHTAVADTLRVTHREPLGDGIELWVAPRHVISMRDFKRHAPAYSIALDGYVHGKPEFDPSGPRLNLNHHEEVDRLGTRATCEQVLINLKQGLLNCFQSHGGPRVNICVNDSDQDVSLSVWLLKNHERVSFNRSEPLITRLVSVEGLLDTTAGAYPFDPKSEVVRELNWIFDPYTQSRISGRLFTATGADMAATIAAVGERITRYSIGRGEKLALDTRYDRIGGGPEWSLVREIGPGARTALFQSGCFAFVSANDAGNGRYKYSIGKMSPFVRFPILALYDVLNKCEGIADNCADRWGGGDIVGGSPRGAGSKLAPAEIEQIVNGYLRMS